MRQAREVGNQERASDYGGASHAGEYETALYLALKPERVKMEKAVDELSPLPPSFQSDLLKGKRPDGSIASYMPFWSTMTESGVRGRATLATPENGEKFLKAAVSGLVELIHEFKSIEIAPRRDHHDKNLEL